MNTWTVFLILSTACVTFCDATGTETRDLTCADQVCPLVCKEICTRVPVDYQVTNSSTPSLTIDQPDPLGLCEPVCETLCKRILGKIGITYGEVRPFGENLFIELTIENKTPEDLFIANAELKWGKWTEFPRCKVEIKSPGGLTIPPNGTVQLKSCGRENSPTGTEGGFDIQVRAGSKQVANIYFDIPWSPLSKEKFELKVHPSSPYLCAETGLLSMGKSVRCQ